MVQGKKDIFEDTVGRHQHEMLVNHADAQSQGVPGAGQADRLAGHQDPAAVGMIKPRQDVHQGALPRPVFPQQGVDFPGQDLEGDLVEGNHAGKCFANALDAQQLSHDPQR